MTQIENQTGPSSLFVSSHSQSFSPLDQEKILEIQAEVLDQFTDTQINVKNLFKALRAVFEVLDKKAPSLNDKSRLKIAQVIISNVIDENQASNRFTSKALKLLSQYSIEIIAHESKPKLTSKEVLEEEQEDYTPVSVSTQLEESNRRYRSRFDDVFASCDEALFYSPKEELPSEGIEVPSKRASKELSKAVADNSEEIDKQAEEAKQYIRGAAIEVDGKVTEIQQRLQDNIEKALFSLDEVRKTVKEALENAQEFSDEIKSEVAKLVNQFAEKMIDAVQAPMDAKIQPDSLKKAEDELDERICELKKCNTELAPKVKETFTKI